jgi:hypothetical protein
MELERELINHPKYGIIKDYRNTLFTKELMTDPNNPDHLSGENPWTEPSEWYSYRCRSCDHTGWVEDIGVDSFPPEKPGGFPHPPMPGMRRRLGL